eukprot:TRINITY_DN74054_c0_g1_i1.p1 TRINITY_DN74054_c0_g1~~TRINITY_DN74054_c0_g1_i1.p1  ORF type:complete len:821 (-),score=175.97 TRINITY_DN74054_c0_g1_i1:343-2646(-)
MARRPQRDLAGFRLILSDIHIAGGQMMKTFKKTPKSISELLALLCEHLPFEDVCVKHDVNVKKVEKDGWLQVVGFDGPRRTPINGDEGLAEFFRSVSHTLLPSLEVELAQSRGKPPAAKVKTEVAPPPVAASVTPKRGKDARDRVEELEDENFRLLRSVDRVERQLDELERKIDSSKEHAERLTNVLRKDLTQSQDTAFSMLQGDIDNLKEVDTRIHEDIAIIRKNITKVDEQDRAGYDELSKRLVALDESTNDRFEDVGLEIQGLRMTDQRLEEEDVRQNKELLRHDKELQRLETVKVDVTVWKEAEEKMAAEMKEGFENAEKRLRETEAEIYQKIHDLHEEMVEADTALEQKLMEFSDKLEREIARVDADIKAGLEKAEENLVAAVAELNKKIDNEVQHLNDKMERGFKDLSRDVAAKDKAIHKRVDEVVATTELTFKGMTERLDEMVRVERARFNAIEKEIAETTTKLRSDLRSDIERVRTDYEQDTARLNEDLADLHMKHDVTKQEINFFQSRLMEQREWAQRQLTETSTATRAAQVDAQEGLAAAQKMLHALRDDAVSFREKMAKYISLLQHSCDGHGDAIGSLETHRSRMRLELDALIGDHKSYTIDMDGWAEDVRIKVERLFRALEPSRVEWRISRAGQRLKELKKPLAMKSPGFAMRGLRDAQMELYPDGHNHSPEGKTALRLFMHPGAKVRYQVWLGSSSDGSREFGQGGNENLNVDLFFDRWKDQIKEDGTLIISMEVLRDHTNEDESLSREVRIET